MNFETALFAHFPNALPAVVFVQRSYEVLQTFGFEASNTLACVSLCRDELTRPFVNEIQKTWGEAFNFSSLAGMLYLGRTGFLAAQHHAPKKDGSERYAFFALPHIGLAVNAEFGLCYRAGRKEPSHACGALMGFQDELMGGSVRLDLDPADIEYSLLKQRLFRKLKYGDIPDLVKLTKIAQAVIVEELEQMIQLTVDSTQNHFAVLTGIQIHGPEHRDFVWPGVMYAVLGGTRHALSLA